MNEFQNGSFIQHTFCSTHFLVSRQGKKFKDKLPAQPGPIDEDFDVGSDDSSGSHEGTEMFSLRPRRNSDRAGEGFVSSIRGLFNSQRKKAKALVLRTRRGPEDLDFEQRSSASDEDRNSVRSPRASLTSITKAKKLLRLQARKHHKVNRLPRGQPFIDYTSFFHFCCVVGFIFDAR